MKCFYCLVTIYVIFDTFAFVDAIATITQDTNVLLGETGELTCETTGTEIYWWDDNTDDSDAVNIFNGSPNMKNPKYTNYSTKKVSRGWKLVILPIEISQEGFYLCDNTAYSPSIERGMGSITVYVQEASISITPSTVNIKEGDSVTIVCNVMRKKPAASVINWMIGSKLKNYTNPVITRNSNMNGTFDTTSTLNFTAKRADNNKTVQCKTNMDELVQEGISTSVTLNIYYSPICTLTIKYDDGYEETKTKGTATCDCDANPSVPNPSSGSYGYMIFENLSIVTNPKNTKEYSFDFGIIQEEMTTIIKCKGTNEHDSHEARKKIPSLPPHKGSVIPIIIGVFAVVLAGGIITELGRRIYLKKKDRGSKTKDMADKENDPASTAPMNNTSQDDEDERHVGLTYAELDHGKAPIKNQVHQPEEEATTYAQVSVPV